MYGDGVVTGRNCRRRPVVVIAQDRPCSGGTVGEMFGRKVASRWSPARAPARWWASTIGGARVQDAVTSLAWYAQMCVRHDLSGFVPKVSILLGKWPRAR